jgi:hypothetical protein
MGGRACTICTHKDRALVELALVHRVPLRVLTRRFGLSGAAISNHKRRHMPPQLKAAILLATKPSEIDLEELRKREGEGLLASLITQRARLAMLSQLCFEQGELHAAVSVEKAITASLELTSKLVGMLVTRHSVTHNTLLISTDYLALRACIMQALRKHPAAAQDVARALAELEASAAQDITDAKKPIMIEASP